MKIGDLVEIIHMGKTVRGIILEIDQVYITVLNTQGRKMNVLKFIDKIEVIS
jgi:hypothetical protein